MTLPHLLHMKVWKVYCLVTFLKLGLLRMTIMNMNMTIIETRPSWCFWWSLSHVWKICWWKILDIYGKSNLWYVHRRKHSFGDFGSFVMEEEHSNFSYYHSKLYYSEPHTSINNKYLEKQCNEESYWVQLVEDFCQPSSSHTDVPYDLEQFGAYT